MRLEEWLERVDQCIQKSFSNATQVHYSEIALELNISPNYARLLLELYAKKNGYAYRKGTLILGEKRE